MSTRAASFAARCSWLLIACAACVSHGELFESAAVENEGESQEAGESEVSTVSSEGEVDSTETGETGPETGTETGFETGFETGMDDDGMSGSSSWGGNDDTGGSPPGLDLCLENCGRIAYCGIPLGLDPMTCMDICFEQAGEVEAHGPPCFDAFNALHGCLNGLSCAELDAHFFGPPSMGACAAEQSFLEMACYGP